jgi:hypothetical protein
MAMEVQPSLLNSRKDKRGGQEMSREGIIFSVRKGAFFLFSSHWPFGNKGD